MGSRATIRIVQSGHQTPIHLYTHWSGYRITEIFAKALFVAKADGRLNDEAYCTRIIFDTLTGLEGGTTGYGIIIGDDAMPADLEYDSPCIDWNFEGEPFVYYTRKRDGYMLTAAMPASEWLDRVGPLEDPSGSDFDLTTI